MILLPTTKQKVIAYRDGIDQEVVANDLGEGVDVEGVEDGGDAAEENQRTRLDPRAGLGT